MGLEVHMDFLQSALAGDLEGRFDHGLADPVVTEIGVYAGIDQNP